MNGMWEMVLSNVGAVLVVVVGFVVYALREKLGGKLNIKKHNTAREVLSNVLPGLIRKAIDAVNQSFVDDLRRSGEWSKNREENAANALEKGVMALNSILPITIRKLIERLHGKGSVDKFLATEIEAALKHRPSNSDEKITSAPAQPTPDTADVAQPIPGVNYYVPPLKSPID